MGSLDRQSRRGYSLVRGLARVLLGLFYRRWEVSRAERVPPNGPLIVCANHHGSLVDPMLLLAGFDRELRPLAKAPLFQVPILGSFLGAVGALPVYRPQDRHLVEGSNRGLFDACVAGLERGAAILIFPEGISKPASALGSLRPGAARMALEAEARRGFELGVKLLPVGIHLRDAAHFRRGTVTAVVGEPLEAARFAETHRRDPAEAVEALTRRLEGALRELVVETESTRDLTLLHLAVDTWAREAGRSPDAGERRELARRFARAYREALERRPAQALRLRSRVEAYARALDHFGLRGPEIDTRYTVTAVLSYLVRQGAKLLLGAPLGILGLLVNWLPFRLTAVLAGRYMDSEDSWASTKMVVALVLFPLWWLALAAATAGLWGLPPALLALVLAPLAGLWAIRFRDQGMSFRRQVRAFLLLAGGGGLRDHLKSSRQAIRDEMEALAAWLRQAGSSGG